MSSKIIRFAAQMELELEKNKHKGSVFEWKGIPEKVADFEYHKAKMMIAMKTGDRIAMKEYIADCANILLSIGNEAGLYEKDHENIETISVLKEEVFVHVPNGDNFRGSNNFFDKIINK